MELELERIKGLKGENFAEKKKNKNRVPIFIICHTSALKEYNIEICDTKCRLLLTNYK